MRPAALLQREDARRKRASAPSGARRGATGPALDSATVAVCGGTGYAGLEAVRILRAHPYFRLMDVFGSENSSARDLGDIDPVFVGSDLRAMPLSKSILDDPPDAALLALPDESSLALAGSLLAAGTRVVDLSSAFRHAEGVVYPSPNGGGERPSDGGRTVPASRAAESYRGADGAAHGEGTPGFSPVYGLSEWSAAAIREASLIANPGCYPTATLLALTPLVRAGLIDPGDPIVVDAKSGVTGAGRKADPAYLFAEVSESLRPYRALDHRHVPEIAAGLGRDPAGIWFVPHLLPVARGLMATCYVRLRAAESRAGAAADLREEVEAAFLAAYRDAPFVRLLGEGRWPELRAVARTNLCVIGWQVDLSRRCAVVIAAIDNLVKGAAGQAVQNLNIMFGRPETEGLLS